MKILVSIENEGAVQDIVVEAPHAETEADQTIAKEIVESAIAQLFPRAEITAVTPKEIESLIEDGRVLADEIADQEIALTSEYESRYARNPDAPQHDLCESIKQNEDGAGSAESALHILNTLTTASEFTEAKRHMEEAEAMRQEAHDESIGQYDNDDDF
jgi:hypothetical protein